MAQQTVEVHYAEACDMPQCMCEGCTVRIFLRGELLTTDGLPYIDAVVESIEDAASGGKDITLTYDDATLPLDAGDPIELVFEGEGATACLPDCLEECDWVWKTQRMIESALPGGLFYLQYRIFEIDEDVANGTFYLPRISFDPGFRLTDVRLTCHEYDINTELAAELRVGATVKAQYGTGPVGNLGQQRQMTIVSADCLNDVLPALHITGLTNTSYGLSAKGLVLHIRGIKIP